MAWLKPQAGPLVDAYPAATQACPALAEAPGTYVLEG
jgi:polyhydroxyalkanoate synthase